MICKECSKQSNCTVNCSSCAYEIYAVFDKLTDKNYSKIRHCRDCLDLGNTGCLYVRKKDKK